MELDELSLERSAAGQTRSEGYSLRTKGQHGNVRGVGGASAGGVQRNDKKTTYTNVKTRVSRQNSFVINKFRGRIATLTSLAGNSSVNY